MATLAVPQFRHLPARRRVTLIETLPGAAAGDTVPESLNAARPLAVGGATSFVVVSRVTGAGGAAMVTVTLASR